jgi:sigma-B regulation protein RsbU (phosphoserine phosphatase)
VGGLDIDAKCNPLNVVGGDFFDFISYTDGSIGIILGDACGHAIGAALLMATTRAHIRAFAQSSPDVAQIVKSVNRMFCEDTSGERFATLVLAKVDPGRQTLNYASAGHEAYILKGNGDVQRLSDHCGFPLGIDPEAKYEALSAIRLDYVDRIIRQSDGILENPDGIEPAVKIIHACRTRSAQEIVAALASAVDFVARRGAEQTPKPLAEALRDDASTRTTLDEEVRSVLASFRELWVMSDDCTAVIVKVA